MTVYYTKLSFINHSSRLLTVEKDDDESALQAATWLATASAASSWSPVIEHDAKTGQG